MRTMTDRYFTRRESVPKQDFEEAYWAVVEDPDGNIRDRREERDRFLQDAAEEIAFLQSLSPGRILDVGCGLGFLLSALPDGWDRYGVEVSEYAAHHAERWGTIHNGELADAGYPDGHFDVVVLYHVIEHVPDPDALLLEVRRILKNGGVLLLGTPDFDGACARRFGERYRLLHDQTHISLFTADSVHRLLRDHGFVIDHVSFPFFETRHFTRENLLRLFDTSRVSPPFYGSFMTFYAHRPVCPNTVGALQRLGICGRAELQSAESTLEVIVETLATRVSSGGSVGVYSAAVGDEFLRLAAQVVRDALVPAEIEVTPLEDEESAGTSFVISLHRTAPPSASPSTADLVLVPEDARPDTQRQGLVLSLPYWPDTRWELGALMVLDGLGKDAAQRVRDADAGETGEESVDE